MIVIDSIAKVAETIAIWLNPQRKERVVLLEAIEAATEIINILENTGKYKEITEARRMQLLIHYKKQFESWKDGTP